MPTSFGAFQFTGYGRVEVTRIRQTGLRIGGRLFFKVRDVERVKDQQERECRNQPIPGIDDVGGCKSNTDTDQAYLEYKTTRRKEAGLTKGLTGYKLKDDGQQQRLRDLKDRNTGENTKYLG